MKSYRYSNWDGTQDTSPVDADDLMDAMAEELMSHGDLNQALTQSYAARYARQHGERF